VLLGRLRVGDNAQWEGGRVDRAGEAGFLEDIFNPGFTFGAHGDMSRPRFGTGKTERGGVGIWR
jgi:hypothetical protein